MDKEKLNKYKEALEAKKADLLNDIKGVPEVTDMGHDAEGESFDEETDEAEEMVNNAAVRKTLDEQLHDVEAALEKINQDAYGQCEQCGKDLEAELLEVDPESKLCKHCKQGQ